jgi:hypothetical protein
MILNWKTTITLIVPDVEVPWSFMGMMTVVTILLGMDTGSVLDADTASLRTKYGIAGSGD